MTTLHQEGAGSNTPRTFLSWAQTYAQAGARVLPLRPQAKVPDLKDWPNAATTDPETVQAWFSNGNANLGLAMGTWANHDTYLVCIDLDVHEADKNGLEAWQRLTEQHGDQGAPFIADTATGGMHLVYQSPIPLSNERGQLPAGIDVRGVGGQIMVQPSTHPDTGTSPKWRGNAWQQGEPGPIPQWLVDLIQTPAIPTTPPEYARPLSQGNDTRPGDEYNRTHTWREVLISDGWTDLGNDKWLRPGKTIAKDQAPSAVLYPQHGAHGVLVVFSSNAPGPLLRDEFHTTTGGHYKLTSPWAYEVAMRHGGDFTNAARTVGQELRRDDERELGKLTTPTIDPARSVLAPNGPDIAPGMEHGHTYKLQQLSDLIGMPYEPRLPELLLMDNGRGLFYSNAHNLVAMASGGGKSWIQAITMHQQIQRGNHVAIIDYEMSMRDWFERLRALGATDSELSLVHYCQPGEPLSTVVAYGERVTMKAWDTLTTEIERIGKLGNLTWVCIDGVTNAMTANSLKLLDNTDISRFWQLLPEHIVRATGAGVGINDHVPKNARAQDMSPIGGQHKVAATTGSAFTGEQKSAMGRNPERDLVVLLHCIKDRHGQVGQGHTVAQVVMSPRTGARIDYQVLPYTGDPLGAANSERAKVLQAVADLNGQGVKATLSKVADLSGVKNKSTCTQHLTVLANSGEVRNMGNNNTHDWQALVQDIDTGQDF